MQTNIQSTLLSAVAANAVAAIAVAAIALLCTSAVQAGPMDEAEIAPGSLKAQAFSEAVAYLERNCDDQLFCGTDEPIIVSLLQGWERDVRLKLADLVAVRFGFALPEQREQLEAPVDDWTPAFLSDYDTVTLSPAHAIEMRRLRYGPQH